eukprot:UN12821
MWICVAQKMEPNLHLKDLIPDAQYMVIIERPPKLRDRSPSFNVLRNDK